MNILRYWPNSPRHLSLHRQDERASHGRPPIGPRPLRIRVCTSRQAGFLPPRNLCWPAWFRWLVDICLCLGDPRHTFPCILPRWFVRLKIKHCQNSENPTGEEGGTIHKPFMLIAQCLPSFSSQKRIPNLSSWQCRVVTFISAWNSS